MPAHKCKKPKVAKDDDHIDRQLVLSIEKLQEIQDELEKVQFLTLAYPFVAVFHSYICLYNCEPEFFL